MKRSGSRPIRRIEAASRLDIQARKALAKRVVYVGSPHHKSKANDYGLLPHAAPRPTKSLCDLARGIPKAEAEDLLRKGVLKGILSAFTDDELPKYIWSVDDSGAPFEAKIGNGGYHGYPLENTDDMSKIVLREWKARS